MNTDADPRFDFFTSAITTATGVHPSRIYVLISNYQSLEYFLENKNYDLVVALYTRAPVESIILTNKFPHETKSLSAFTIVFLNLLTLIFPI